MSENFIWWQPTATHPETPKDGHCRGNALIALALRGPGMKGPSRLRIEEMHLPAILPWAAGTAMLRKQMLLVLLSWSSFPLFFICCRKRQLVPASCSSLGEMSYSFVRNRSPRTSSASRDFMKYVPLLFALFFFILVNNIYGCNPADPAADASHVAAPTCWPPSCTSPGSPSASGSAASGTSSWPRFRPVCRSTFCRSSSRSRSSPTSWSARSRTASVSSPPCWPAT